MGKRYKTSETTCLAISGALKQLMTQKPLERITVAEIMDTCGMRRQHFYYYFTDIYDLLRWTFEKEALELLRQQQGVSPWQNGFLHLFQYINQNRAVCLCALESLGFAYYDRELLKLAAERAEVGEELFADKDEKAGNPWLFKAFYQGGPKVKQGQSAEDVLFQMQSEIIRELAEKEDCIIVGRCADLVLTGQDVDCLSLFICAPFEWRVHHRMELENLDEKAARALVEKTDAQREKYYTHYTGRPWGLPENYDICINSARLGIDRTAALLAEHCRELFSNPC